MNLIACRITGIDTQNVLCNGFPFGAVQIHIRGVFTCQRNMRGTIQRLIHPHHKNIDTGCGVDQLALFIIGTITHSPALQRRIQSTIHLFTYHGGHIAVDVDKEEDRKKCDKEKD